MTLGQHLIALAIGALFLGTLCAVVFFAVEAIVITLATGLFIFMAWGIGNLILSIFKDL